MSSGRIPGQGGSRGGGGAGEPGGAVAESLLVDLHPAGEPVDERLAHPVVVLGGGDVDRAPHGPGAHERGLLEGGVHVRAGDAARGPGEDRVRDGRDLLALDRELPPDGLNGGRGGRGGHEALGDDSQVGQLAWLVDGRGRGRGARGLEDGGGHGGAPCDGGTVVGLAPARLSGARRGAARRARSEQAGRRVVHAPHGVVVEDDAAEASVLGEHAGLRLDGLGREDASHGREERVAVEEPDVPGQLLDAVDAADALDLDGDAAAGRVLDHEVDGADGRGVLAAHEAVALAEDLGLLRQELLEVSLHAVLGEARVDAEVRRLVGEDLEETDDEEVVALAGPDLPLRGDAGLEVLLVRLDLLHGGRRAHPVERLVGAAVGVDEHGAVRLDHDEAGGPGQVGVQAPGVVHGAGSDDDAHRGSLPGVAVGSSQHPMGARTAGGSEERRLVGRRGLEPGDERRVRVLEHGEVVVPPGAVELDVDDPAVGAPVPQLPELDVRAEEAQPRPPGERDEPVPLDVVVAEDADAARPAALARAAQRELEGAERAVPDQSLGRSLMRRATARTRITTAAPPSASQTITGSSLHRARVGVGRGDLVTGEVDRDGEGVVVERAEAPLDGDRHGLAGGRRQPDLAVGDDGEDGLTPGQDADLAVEQGDGDLRGLPLPGGPAEAGDDLDAEVLDAAAVEEGLLGQVVVVAVGDALEGLDGLRDRHGGAGDAGELLAHVHVLGEELLDTTCTCHDDLLLLGQLVHAEDRDDVLELLVLLEDGLHARGDLVVLLTDVLGGEEARGRGQRVDRGVDASGGDLAGELGGGVQVREGRRRGRVGVVVRRDVDRLEGGDRVPAGGGDALLEEAHLVGQVRLVTHGGGHAPQQRGDLGAGLREAEDVVDEEQHVLVLHVAEVLGHGEGREGDAQARARRLVHLAEHERGLVEDAGLAHLDDEVVALTGALADAGEDGHAVVVEGDSLDHLLDEDGLADAGAAEETDLAALDVRGEQVDDLDARLEHLLLRLELVEGRGLAVDGPALGDLEGLALLEVEDVTGDVEDVALGDVADGHGDRGAGVAHLGAAHEAVGGLEGDGAHDVVAQVLGDLERDLAVLVALAGALDGHLEGVVHLGQRLGRELDVDDGADDPRDAAGARRRVGGVSHGSFFRVRFWQWSLAVRSLGAEGVGTRDDLRDLLGDVALSRRVGEAGVTGDEVLGVVRGRVHGLLTAGELRGGGLEDGVTDAAAYVAGEEGVQDDLRARHELVQRLEPARVGALQDLGALLGDVGPAHLVPVLEVHDGQRQHATHLGDLLDHGDVAGEHDVHLADAAVGRRGQEVAQQDAGDLVDRRVGRAVRLPHPGALDVAPAEGEVRVGTASEGEDDGLLALLDELVDEALGLAQDRRRVGAGHAAVRGDDEDGDALGVGALLRDRVVEVGVGADGGHRLGEGVVVGPGLLRVAPGGTDPGGGDELHGPEHLLEAPLEDDLLARPLGRDVLLAGGDLAGQHTVARHVGLAEGLDGVAQGGLGLLGQVAGLADRGEDAGVAAQVVEQGVLEGQHVLDLEVVEVAVRAGPDADDLLLDRVRRVLRLLEELHEPLTAGELLTGGGVEVGGEHREGLHRAVLREGQLERSGDLLHGLDLGGATDSGDGDADVDGGALVGVEEVRLEEDLAVGDGDDVRRDVGGHVVRLRLDDRQTRHRAGAELVGELGAALEEARVQVEDVTGVGLAARRTAEQEGHRSVGLSLLREVVEDDEDVLAGVHPVLADGRAGVGGEVLEAGGVGRRGAALLQGAADGGDGGALLAGRDVDAPNLLVGVPGLPGRLLVEDGVQRDGRLARLAVADDELALAAADRDHGVDGLEPGLQRLVDRLAGHDSGSLELEGAAPLRLDLAEAVDGTTERVDDAAEVAVADGDGEDLAGAADGLALVDTGEVAEHDDADLALVEVHRQAGGAVLEGEQLVGHDAGQALDVGNAVRGEDDVPDLLGGDLGGLVGLDELIQGGADLLRPDGQFSHLSSPCAREGGAQLREGGAHGGVDDEVAHRDLDAADDGGVDLGVELDVRAQAPAEELAQAGLLVGGHGDGGDDVGDGAVLQAGGELGDAAQVAWDAALGLVAHAPGDEVHGRLGQVRGEEPTGEADAVLGAGRAGGLEGLAELRVGVEGLRHREDLLLDRGDRPVGRAPHEDGLDAEVVEGGDEVDRLGPAAADERLEEGDDAVVDLAREQAGDEARLVVGRATGVGQRAAQPVRRDLVGDREDLAPQDAAVRAGRAQDGHDGARVGGRLLELVEEAVDDAARRGGVRQVLADDLLRERGGQQADVVAEGCLGGLLVGLDLALGGLHGLAGLAGGLGARLRDDGLGLGLRLLADLGGLTACGLDQLGGLDLGVLLVALGLVGEGEALGDLGGALVEHLGPATRAA
ncbi:Acetylglutamate semialdehyde dehydrogenase [Ceratobasidium theobromae]|uniref:Acetylglutamate semialdehyde dehydrogenase n=1 Tax=Ceratobasidium theobromae TaxID=1582974 RepID=A0A5N5Q8N6_9AGAM|nr:Acetylglutamate semialdehyde dehydrogenase [Ceratobasidium theobromae]